MYKIEKKQHSRPYQVSQILKTHLSGPCRNSLELPLCKKSALPKIDEDRQKITQYTITANNMNLKYGVFKNRLNFGWKCR